MMHFDSERWWRPAFTGWPVPRMYQPSFQTEPAYLSTHWHLFWASADSLHVVLPPLGTGGGTWSPASIEALAQVLVADVRAETEPQEETEDKQ